MSEIGEEHGSQGLKVTDKRRFDMEGNTRDPQSAASAGSPAGTGNEAIDPVIGARETSREESPVEAAAETPDAEPSAPASVPPEEVERLKNELEAARRRVDELARAYQNGERDREEFKQRLTREREQLLDVERGKVALMVIEAIDELDLCLQASGSDSSPLAQGVRLIRGNLVSKVQSAGIERLDLVGKPYDPNLAEAVDMEVTDDPNQDGAMVFELRAGYRLKSRVIRPARVKIAKYVRPAEA